MGWTSFCRKLSSCTCHNYCRRYWCVWYCSKIVSRILFCIKNQKQLYKNISHLKKYSISWKLSNLLRCLSTYHKDLCVFRKKKLLSISEVVESDPRMVCTAKRTDRVMVNFDGFCENFGFVKWLWEMCAFIVSLPSSPKLPTAVAASISYFQRR